MLKQTRPAIGHAFQHPEEMPAGGGRETKSLGGMDLLTGCKNSCREILLRYHVRASDAKCFTFSFHNMESKQVKTRSCE